MTERTYLLALNKGNDITVSGNVGSGVTLGLIVGLVLVVLVAGLGAIAWREFSWEMTGGIGKWVKVKHTENYQVMGLGSVVEGLGAGSALMAYVALEAESAGKTVVLSASNIASDSFYRQLGVEWVSEEDYGGEDYDQEDAVLPKLAAQRLRSALVQGQVKIETVETIKGLRLAKSNRVSHDVVMARLKEADLGDLEGMG